jgi:hypothetical protein
MVESLFVQSFGAFERVNGRGLPFICASVLVIAYIRLLVSFTE